MAFVRDVPRRIRPTGVETRAGEEGRRFVIRLLMRFPIALVFSFSQRRDSQRRGALLRFWGSGVDGVHDFAALMCAVSRWTEASQSAFVGESVSRWPGKPPAGKVTVRVLGLVWWEESLSDEQRPCNWSGSASWVVRLSSLSLDVLLRSGELCV